MKLHKDGESYDLLKVVITIGMDCDVVAGYFPHLFGGPFQVVIMIRPIYFQLSPFCFSYYYAFIKMNLL